MSWPTPAEINEAIQNPQLSFKDPELSEGKPETDAHGIPLARSGSNADVYCFYCGAERVAVKCFTRPIAHLEQRYQVIHNALSNLQRPYTVGFSYHSEGLWLRDEWYPLVRMQWVDGIRLNEFARSMLGRSDILQNLIQTLAKVSDWLHANNLGHCDLQHGNILLIRHGGGRKLSVRLVDYDGMWVPALAHEPPQEFGHPDYQHPQRMAQGYYGPATDRFSLLAIATGLRALTVHGQDLWQRCDNSVNIVFQQQDFADPHRSRLFQELGRSPDETLRRLCGTLAESCGASIERVPHLSDVLNDVSKPATSARALFKPKATPAPSEVLPTPPQAAARAAPEAPPTAPQVDTGDHPPETQVPTAPSKEKLPTRPPKRKPKRSEKQKLIAKYKRYWPIGLVALLQLVLLIAWVAGAFKSGSETSESESEINGPSEGNDDRDLWFQKRGGYFIRGLEKDWFEKLEDSRQRPRRYVEVQRTNDFVELRHSADAVTIQLFTDKAAAKNDRRSDQVSQTFEGAWKSIQGTSSGRSGRYWVHSHGYFLHGLGTDWFEKYKDGQEPPMRFVEVGERGEYLELSNANYATTFHLYRDKALLKTPKTGNGFASIYFGKWKTDAN